MPGLVHKLVVLAAVDGIVLQPLGHRNQGLPPPILIEYKTRRLTSWKQVASEEQEGGHSFEAHGIVGLLKVASVSFLISITRRKQVAQIQGRPIYVITGVAITPLSSQGEASKAIEQTKESLRQSPKDDAFDSASSDDESDHSEHQDGSESPVEVEDKAPPGPLERPGHKRVDSTVAEDVISKKGVYGRFAESWFSKKGWDSSRRRSQGMSHEGSAVQPAQEARHRPDSLGGPENEMTRRASSRRLSVLEAEDLTSSLIPKLLRTTKMLLTSNSFFFSYDYDITRRLGTQKPNKSNLPMHRIVDPLFFWNQFLAEPFIREGHHGYVLPVMQGFVGQRAFTIDTAKSMDAISKGMEDPGDVLELQNYSEDGKEANKDQDKHDFLVTLLSRRSIKRPGLRYLRRGVDDDGHTANTVETEQILSVPSWNPLSKIYSFTQIRGSIPIYFSQSPYSFKPIPILHHSPSRNQEAFHRHFVDIRQRYGKVHIALLIDKKGGEAKIGEEYEKYVKLENEADKTDSSRIGFEWFDFHAECRGMKFEHVNLLTNTLETPLRDFGETVEVNGAIVKQQAGIVRTNCMDCLDRTNVVESALAQRALQQQLQSEGVEIDLQTDQTTRWFNTLWADNGDAISRQYSSTAALKGDFTRTRQRNYRGALNDLGLTLTRYWNNVVNDYFSQAAIDFLLGNVDASVFEEFESTMMSVDPGVSLDRVRQNAIESCSKIVISDKSEEFIAGWTLLSPHQPNTLRTLPFQETVLLLTDAAIYHCKFDWDTEKVLLFQRMDLPSITGIHYGTYITSTTSQNQMNEKLNVGFVVLFKPGKESIMRVNTRSLQSSVEDKDQADTHNSAVDANEVISEAPSTTKSRSADGILAFKALPSHPNPPDKSKDGEALKPIALVRGICEEIERAIMAGEGSHVERKSIIEATEIISLAEARKRTGILESTIYSLKRLVWT